MTPGVKLITLAAIQVLILLSVIGFREYAVRTGHTVTLKVVATDPHSLLHDKHPYVRYEAANIDKSSVQVDGSASGEVYVEFQQKEDGYWHAIAIHDDHRRSASGTVLIKGNASPSGPRSAGGNLVFVDYDIEQVAIPQASAGALPSGSNDGIGVQIQVDRFGSPIAQQFIIDGARLPLERR